MSWARAMVGWVSSAPAKPRVLWLGLCCWVIAALLPSLHRASQLGWPAFALLGLSPFALGLGLTLYQRFPVLAAYVLLCGFPVSLALSMGQFEHELALITYSPVGLFFALVSLAGYAASVSQLGAAHEPERQVEHKPLGEVPPVDGEHRKQRAGLTTLSAITLGAVVCVFWGSWQPPAGYREHWGRSAATGAVTTALIAGVAGGLAIAFVAPGLRAERKRNRREPTRVRRLLRPLLTAASFALLYWMARSR